jgi:hypothetical protein
MRTAHSTAQWTEHPAIDAEWLAVPRHGFVECNWVEPYGTGMSDRSLLIRDDQVLGTIAFLTQYLIDRKAHLAEVEQQKALAELESWRGDLLMRTDTEGHVTHLGVSESETVVS